MNRTAKDATLKTYHYPDLETLQAPILAFITAYNFARHLQALRWQALFQGNLRRLKSRPVSLQDQPTPPHPRTVHLGSRSRPNDDRRRS